MLESSSFAPAYSRLYQELASDINNGRWKPGDQLPTERELADRHGLSIGTVRKSMDMLEQAGFCIKAQGKGTFVADYTEDKPFFYRMRRGFSAKDISVHTGTAERAECPLPDDAARSLNLPPNAPGIRITRTLHGHDQHETAPLGVSESWFSRDACPQLMDISPSDMKKHSLYYLLERSCRKPMLHCDELISFSMEGTPLFASLFDGTPPPCFKLVMVVYTYESMPLEYRVSHIDASSMGLMRKHDFRL